MIDDKEKKHKVVITGFDSFGGRNLNASWQAVSSVDAPKGIELIKEKIAVVWGQAYATAEKLIEKHSPDIFLALGEADYRHFTVESIARNITKDESKDENGELPPNKYFLKDGAEEFRNSLDCQKLAYELSQNGLPTKVSENTGGYLCEEMYYSLNYIRDKKGTPDKVLFAHVPWIGHEIDKDGEIITCDEIILKNFVETLLALLI